MKAKNRKTGEIVYIVSFSPYTNRSDADYVSYIDSKGVEHSTISGLNYYWDFEVIEESGNDIDWEERRYQIAKLAMQGLLANDDLIEYKEGYAESVAYSAVCYADALIRELKGK